MTKRKVSRKGLVLILVCCFVLLATATALLATNAFAAGEQFDVKFTATAKLANGDSVVLSNNDVGETTFTVSYKLEAQAPGFTGLLVQLDYDTDIFEIVGQVSVATLQYGGVQWTGTASNAGTEKPMILWEGLGGTVAAYEGTAENAISVTFRLKDGVNIEEDTALEAGIKSIGLKYIRSYYATKGRTELIDSQTTLVTPAEISLKYVGAVSISDVEKIEYTGKALKVIDSSVQLPDDAVVPGISREETYNKNFYVQYTYNGYKAEGDSKVSATWYNAAGTQKIDAPISPGTYQLAISVGEGEKYIAAPEVRKTVVISKFDLAMTEDDVDVNVGSVSKTYTGNTIKWTADEVSIVDSFIADYAKIDSVYVDASSVIDADDYDLVIYVMVKDAWNFSIGDGTDAEFTKTVQITQATNDWQATITASGKTYNGSPATVSATPIFGADTITYQYRTQGQSDSDWIDEAPVNAGSYEVRAQVAATKNWTALTSDVVSYTINRANIKSASTNVTESWLANLSLPTDTYKGAKYTYTVADLIGWNADLVDGYQTITLEEDSSTDHTSVGAHYYTITLTADDNHKFYSGNSDVVTQITARVSTSITQYTVVVVPATQNVVYDGDAYNNRIGQGRDKYDIYAADGQSPVGDFVETAISNGSLVITLTAATVSGSSNWRSQGTYDLAMEYSGDDSKNYAVKLADGAGDGKFIIGFVRVPIPTFSWVYDGQPHKPENGDGYVIVTGDTEQTNVGDYPFMVRLQDSNYVWDDENGSTAPKSLTWHITARPVTITFKSGTWEYSDELNSGNLNRKGLDAVTIDDEYAENNLVWSYIWGAGFSEYSKVGTVGQITGTTSDTNYDVKFVAADVTIVKKQIDAKLITLNTNESYRTEWEYDGTSVTTKEDFLFTFTSTQTSISAREQGQTYKFTDIVKFKDIVNANMDVNKNYYKDGGTTDDYNRYVYLTYVFVDPDSYEFINTSNSQEVVLTQQEIKVTQAINTVQVRPVVELGDPDGTPTMTQQIKFKFGNEDWNGTFTVYDSEDDAKANGSAHSGTYARGTDYYAAFTLAETENYTGFEGETVWIEKFQVKTVTISRPTILTYDGTEIPAGGVNYNGQDQKLTVNHTNPDGYTLIWKINGDVNDGAWKNAGSYELTIQLNPGYAWSTGLTSANINASLVIKPVNLTLTLIGEIVVREGDAKPANTVNVNGFVADEDLSTYSLANWDSFIECTYDPITSKAGDKITYGWYADANTRIAEALSGNYTVSTYSFAKFTVLPKLMLPEGWEGIHGTYNGEDQEILDKIGTISQVVLDSDLNFTYIIVEISSRPATSAEELRSSEWESLGMISINGDSFDYSGVTKGQIKNVTDGEVSYWLKFSDMYEENEDVYFELKVQIDKLQVKVAAKSHRHTIDCPANDDFATDITGKCFILYTSGDEALPESHAAYNELQFTTAAQMVDGTMKMVLTNKTGSDVLANYEILEIANGDYTIVTFENTWTTKSDSNGTVQDGHGLWVRNNNVYLSTGWQEGVDYYATAEYPKQGQKVFYNIYTVNNDGALSGEVYEIKDVGIYWVKISVLGTEFYEMLTDVVQIEVKPATITITVEIEQTYEFSNAMHRFTWTPTSSNCAINNGESLILSQITASIVNSNYTDGTNATTSAPRNAQTYTAQLQISVGSYASDNYEIVVEKTLNGAPQGSQSDLTVDVTLIITPATLEITVDTSEQTSTYNGTTQSYDTTGRITVPSNAANLTANNIGVTITYTQGGSDATPQNVGTYIASLTFAVTGAHANNYIVVVAGTMSNTATTTFVITPATLSITIGVATQNTTYDNTTKQFTVTKNVGANPDNIKPSQVLVELTYAISGQSATPINAGTYDVTLTITLADSLDAIKGNYVIEVNGDSSNVVTAQLVIARAVVTLTAEDKTSAYGDPLEPFSFTISGNTYGNTFDPKYECEVSPTSDVGSYEIELYDCGNEENFDVRTKKGTYTLTIGVNEIKTITIPEGLKYLDEVKEETFGITTKFGASYEYFFTIAPKAGGQKLRFNAWANSQKTKRTDDAYRTDGYLNAGTWTIELTVLGDGDDFGYGAHYGDFTYEFDFTISPRKVDTPTITGYSENIVVTWSTVTMAEGKTIFGESKVMYRVDLVGGAKGALQSAFMFEVETAGIYNIYAVAVTSTGEVSPNFEQSEPATTREAVEVHFTLGVQNAKEEVNLVDLANATISNPALRWPMTYVMFTGTNLEFAPIAPKELKSSDYVYNEPYWTYGEGIEQEPVGFEITGEITFTALYNYIQLHYTITFYLAAGDGEDSFQTVATETVEYGQNLTSVYSKVLDAQEKVTWFRIDGWYVNAYGTEKAPTIAPGQDLELMAKYVLDIGLGDVNADGRVNVEDINLYRKYIVGGYTEIIVIGKGQEWNFVKGISQIDGKSFESGYTSYFIESVSDVLADGSSDIRDITKIRMAIVGGYGVDLDKSGTTTSGWTIVETPAAETQTASNEQYSANNEVIVTTIVYENTATTTSTSCASTAVSEATEKARRAAQRTGAGSKAQSAVR